MSGFFKFDQESREPEEPGCLPAMSFKERFFAFCFCMGLSFLIDMLSWGSIVGVIAGKPARFALTYTFGKILAFAGSGFLIGFERQAKSMFDVKRRWTSVIFLTAMIMVLVSALVLKNALLTLVFIVIEVSAFIWYVASYVPWGRNCLVGCFKSCFRYCLR